MYLRICFVIIFKYIYYKWVGIDDFLEKGIKIREVWINIVYRILVIGYVELIRIGFFVLVIDSLEK